MAHAHGKLRQGKGPARAQRLSQLTQGAECRAGTLRLLCRGRNAHQPADFQVRQGHQLRPELLKLLRGKAMLTLLAIHIHLQQNTARASQLTRNARYRLGQAQRIHRLQQPEPLLQRLAHLVALQRADEVPLTIRRHLRHLAHGLLQAVLTKKALTICVGLHDILHREGLAHRQQLHAAGLAPSPLLRLRNMRLNLLQLVLNVHNENFPQHIIACSRKHCKYARG